MPIENIVAAAELSAVTDPVGNCMGILLRASRAPRHYPGAQQGSATALRLSSSAFRDDSSYQTGGAARRKCGPDVSRGAWFFRAGACMKD
ncbi:hypothetical protein WK33_11785 [Burkholderia multivorans]|nr:hypothetical protein WK33_11785 [Burkholderia multivorans]PRF18184.1 hypothetical protein C6Q03_26075 [Burkholderia multivorans]